MVGYSIAFGEGNSFIGGLQYLFLHGVGADPNPDYAPTIPQGTFMIYQLMFAIITPALISGAFAERMKFSGMLLFTIVWTLFVYFPMAHMVWGKNGFLGATWGQSLYIRFRGRNRRTHHFGRFRARLRSVSRKEERLRRRSHRPHSLVLSTVGGCYCG